MYYYFSLKPLEESFYKSVTQWNERIVRLQAQSLLLLEKYYLGEQVSFHRFVSCFCIGSL